VYSTPKNGTAMPGSPDGPPRSRASGQVIMIVGPDGAGKTTLCTALVEQLSANVRVRLLAKRPGAERPGILPHREPRGSSAQPHRHPAYSAGVSLGKALYYTADFSLGWMLKVVPFVRRGGCVIIERGCWDMLVDPLRYRLRLSPTIRRVLAHAMPRPAVVLVLWAPPEVITARKAQLSPAELRRQMDAWDEVLPRRQRRVRLDTSAPLEQVVQEALRAVEGKARGAVSATPCGPPNGNAESAAEMHSARGMVWLPLLRRLTQISSQLLIWKNASAALQGHGDLDVIAPRSAWPEIEAEFRRWANAERLEPVAVCRHSPGSMFLLVPDRERPAFYELDVKSRGTFRGATVFSPHDLQRMAEMDACGFRRLRPGAEGLLKMFLNGITKTGELDHGRLQRERVHELLEADRQGVELAAQLFGPSQNLVLRLVDGFLRGEWDVLGMRSLQARLRRKLLLEPGTLVRRVLSRAHLSRGCRGIKFMLKEHRLKPEDGRARDLLREHAAADGRSGESAQV